jgi:hypothetical protein
MLTKKVIPQKRGIVYAQGMKYMFLALASLMATSRAETVTLTPVADNSLIGKTLANNNNMGAEPTMAVGGFASGGAGRGLLRFDLAAIPRGATITSVSLALTVVKVPSGQQASIFTLNRMLRSWAEGSKSGQTGQPASPGESTWETSGNGDWSAPGGASGDDFSASSSSAVNMSTATKYTFASTPDLVADVQGWVNDPATNFGWMLKADLEATHKTAKRIASRQATAPTRPSLKVDFILPPAGPRITSLSLKGGGLVSAISVVPTADSAILEEFPENNLGAWTDMPVGGISSTRPSGEAFRCRGLLRFALEGVPAGAKISKASLRISIGKVPSPAENSTLGLHRLLRSWGEGSTTGNNGDVAGAGEVSWITTGSGDWTTPGGQPGNDFDSSAHGTTATSGTGSYVFLSDAQLVNDVQDWLDNPAQNFGWMIKSADEATPKTAKRVASRESSDPALRPQLALEFATPPMVHLEWAGGAAGYQVQHKNSLSDPVWENVSPVLTSTVADLPAGGDTGFYRIASGL